MITWLRCLIFRRRPVAEQIINDDIAERCWLARIRASA